MGKNGSKKFRLVKLSESCTKLRRNYLGTTERFIMKVCKSSPDLSSVFEHFSVQSLEVDCYSLKRHMGQRNKKETTVFEEFTWISVMILIKRIKFSNRRYL